MKATIFYRERKMIGEGDRQPRFKLVAIAGVEMKLYGRHLRKSELKQIAKVIGADLVLLEGGDKVQKNDEDVSVYD